MKKLLLLLALAIPLLCSCSTQKQNEGNIFTRECLGGGYYYLIDNNTGVVYLEHYVDGYRYGITVMYNADGSIMTKDDIKSE